MRGFSLVELSIVLVILGLLVGGILSGQALITAAEQRAQLAQIDRYRAAIHTFRDKYFAIPGDLPAATATRLNFITRPGLGGRGDGNGVIQGYDPVGGVMGTMQATGEPVLFWADLTSAGLIEGNFTAASATVAPPDMTSGFEAYFPKSKIGTNSVYVWSGGKGPGNSSGNNGINYLGISTIHIMTVAQYGYFDSYRRIPVQQAWNIDNKIDDGLPLTGQTLAQFVGFSAAPLWTNIDRMDDPATVPVAYSTTTCIDNGNVGGAPIVYSTLNGNRANCALSFMIR